MPDASPAPTDPVDAPPLLDADRLARLQRLPLDAVDPRRACRAFGVDYVELDLPDGGELYVTRHGWPRLRYLLPEAWFVNRRFLTLGARLSGGTGSVYHVPATAGDGRACDLVVKFSRFAQDVPLLITAKTHPHTPPEMLQTVRFNEPFEEFGAIHALRGALPPWGRPAIRTHRPLAIYCPPRRVPMWQLGRSSGRTRVPQYRLRVDQASHGLPKKIDLHADREYILLYEWVKGHDAEWFHEQGVLGRHDMEALTRRVAGELRDAGYVVLDHKPKHFILRQRGKGDAAGPLLSRDGELVYALIDFELLLPLAPRHRVCRIDERERG